MFTTAVMSLMCGGALVGLTADARQHTAATPRWRRWLGAALVAAVSVILAGLVASFAPVVTHATHEIVSHRQGEVVLSWRGYKPPWAGKCQRHDVAVLIEDRQGLQYAATGLRFSAPTGEVTRPSGWNDFGTWAIEYPAGIDAHSVTIRSLHQCPMSPRPNQTDNGPWVLPAPAP